MTILDGSAVPDNGTLAPGALLAWLDAATDIARGAGALVGKRYAKGHEETQKGHAHNLVTETDHASEELIVGEMARRFPDHGVRAEEGRDRGAIPGDVDWVVDPLDGTNNFAHGFPMFCVSLAAMRGDEVSGGGYVTIRCETRCSPAGGRAGRR